MYDITKYVTNKYVCSERQARLQLLHYVTNAGGYSGKSLFYVNKQYIFVGQIMSEDQYFETQ